MNLILTAAGKYTRFHRFSYEIPKYLLPVGNRNVLRYVLSGFENLGCDKFTFVGNKKDVRFYSPTVETIKDVFPEGFNCMWISDTKGQAQTLLRSLDNQEDNVPIMVHNVDTILLGRDWGPEEIWEADCVVDVFESSNRSYSYVIETDGLVEEIREKEVISNKSSSGCYYFKSAGLIKKYITEETNYISEAINNMIQDGLDVRATKMHKASQTIVLGTPEEYLANLEDLRAFGR